MALNMSLLPTPRRPMIKSRSPEPVARDRRSHDVAERGGRPDRPICDHLVWFDRPPVLRRLLTAVRFLDRADCYHGIFPHWLDGRRGETVPFSRQDDGADLVETSFLLMGLLTARQYFDRSDPVEAEFRSRIDALWPCRTAATTSRD